jgi:hypothetical protein
VSRASKRSLPGERFKGRRLFRKAATIEEQRLNPFLPHLFEGEKILEWITAKTLHGKEGTLAVSDTRLFWCDEPLDTGAVEVFDYRRIHAVGAKRSKHFLVVRAIREGLLEAEVASGDIYDGHGWQLLPGQRSRLLLDIMATGMKAAGTLESAQQRFLDTWGTPRS